MNNKSPLEMCDPEPVWCGTEEEKYVPIEDDHYYNTAIVAIVSDGNEVATRHMSVRYEKYLAEWQRWHVAYADYNGLTTQRKQDAEAYAKATETYHFCLGKKGQRAFEDFISKYRSDKYKTGMNPPNYYYVFVIHPTELGDVVDCEVRCHDANAKLDYLIEKQEIVNMM